MDQTGHGERHTGELSTARVHGRDRLADQVRQAVERRTRVEVGDVERDALLEDDVAGQVERGDGEVVDVDLGADAADAGAVELDELAGAAEGAGGVGRAFAEQAALDELGDQAADGRLVQAGVGGDPGARSRAEVADVPQHHGEVVAAERDVIGGDTPVPRATTVGQRHPPPLPDFVC